jgi:glycosyltransferase 2 family protein
MRKFVLIVVKFAISGGLLYFATRQLDFSTLGARLNRIEPLWIFAAIVIALLQNGLVSIRWRWIIGICGAALPMIRSFRFNLVSAFFGQVLPATVGADAARIVLLARDGAGWWKATCSVLLDRFVGLLSLAIMATGGLYWSFQLIQNPVGRLVLLVTGLGIIAAATLFLAMAHLRWLQQWRLTRRFSDLSALANKILFSNRASALIILSSLLGHGMTGALTWSLGQAVAAQLGFVDALLLILPVMLISTVPISIGGWGVRESALVLAFSYAGLPESDGLIISVLFGGVMLVVGIVGGFVWLASPEKIRLSAALKSAPPAP